jgi:uncharacterized protein YbaP (TraB family)
MIRILKPAFAAAAALILAGAPSAWAKPPVWVAHGDRATVTIFGSVHVLPGKLDWEPQALKDAIQSADELWFETPINPADLLDAARLALSKGLLPPNESLLALLPDDAARAEVNDMAARLNVPIDQLDRLRPWLAELTLAQAAYARDGASADQGVERQLADGAAQAERHAFETAEQQIRMFADTAVADQIASLMDTLRELRDDPDSYRRLTREWLAGDLKGIDRDAIQSLKATSPALFKVLLTDRNAAWRTALIERLRRPGKVVVVVGVGHLIGPDGLPQLLRDRGIRVDGPRP